MLKTLETVHTGSCLLAPPHVGLLTAAREKMGDAPALFVIQPDALVARTILACQDFSDAIRRHRFWIVTGENWPDQFRALLRQYNGLATPTRFIRTKLLTDDVALPMIKTAQDLFSEILSERTRELERLKSQKSPVTDRREVLLIGGSAFRLWDHPAAVLEAELSQAHIHRFDTDDPLNGSPAMLLEAAAACGSVVSANLCRDDCNQIITTEKPWITWITQPAVPKFDIAGPADGLVLADPRWKKLAQKAGWPDDRVRIGGWPPRADHQSASPSPSQLAMICDTGPIEIPQSVKDFSSHRLLWELIEEELHDSPLAVEQIDAYLTDRAGQLNITIESLDRRSFIQCLIHPAYQQGLARLLIKEGLPITLWGDGWPSEFDAHHRGTITTPSQLDHAIDDSAALIYCWPERSAHPIDTCNKPIVERSGQDKSQLLRNARRALTSPARKAPMPATQLAKQICDLLSM